jgi:hypothetical protein
MHYNLHAASGIETERARDKAKQRSTTTILYAWFEIDVLMSAILIIIKQPQMKSVSFQVKQM